MTVAPGPMSGRTSMRPQFGIGAMLWATLVVALALGYLRQFNAPTLFPLAAIVMTTAAIVGGLIGWPVGRMGEAAYWAVVIAAAAFLSVAGDLAAPATFRYAWSSVGLMAGAACGAVAPAQLWRRILAGTVAGGAVMAVFLICTPSYDPEWMFDLVCAPIIGGLVAVLIELIFWLERRRYSPRYITACWLLCAVIVGNLLVPWALA